MTIKEITTLRKAGHLQEALTAAENEFANHSNNYTAGALFWCLNDVLKQQSGEDDGATIERMHALYNDFCNGDEFMQKAIATAERRRLPHYQEIKDAVENAKNGGDAITWHHKMSEWYHEGNLDKKLYPDFGWLIYYALKQTNLGETQNRKTLLNQYLKLNLPRPSILHSLILGEAIKIEQTTPLQFRIRDFIRIWGLENLRTEDWEQYKTNEGHTLPSLVEKLIGVYAKELKTDGIKSPDDFSNLVDNALTKYPKSQNMPYFKATVLISQGKKEEALDYYKNLILQYPSKFYLWNQTAELIEDYDTKIGLLCKALTCGTEDEFLGGVRLRLASLLNQKGLKENAKYELEKYRETYQKQGWNLKPNFREMYNPLLTVSAVADNKALYAEFAAKAEEFIYSSLPTTMAVKVAETQNADKNHPGRKITTWIFRSKNDTIRLKKPTKFGLHKHSANGTFFDIKLQDNKIVWIKPHVGSINESWIKEGSGIASIRTDRNGKKYTIISDSYVGENLLKGINDGQQIKILALQQNDGRWAAIKILSRCS